MENKRRNPDLYCHFCGSAREVSAEECQRCASCGGTFYKNPKPIAVLIIPTGDGGIYTVRRGIEPCKGKLALPGGFIVEGESWREASLREAREELDLHFFRRHEEDLVRHLRTESSPDGTLILIAGYATVPPAIPDPFRKNREAEDRVIYRNEHTDHIPFEELCFPFHRKVAEEYFSLQEHGRL